MGGAMKKRKEELTKLKRSYQVAEKELLKSIPEKLHFWRFAIKELERQIDLIEREIKSEKK